MFVAGPPVVNRLSPKQYDKQELGGWEIQLRAGAIDEATDSEDEAFACARRFLSYLPSSIDTAAAARPADRRSRRGARTSLFDVIPRDIRKVYRIRPIVEKIVDQGSFFEMGRLYGRSVVTGLRPHRRLAGRGAWRATRCSTAAAGRPTPARRSRASSTSPRPSICRWSISATARAS